MCCVNLFAYCSFDCLKANHGERQWLIPCFFCRSWNEEEKTKKGPSECKLLVIMWIFCLSCGVVCIWLAVTDEPFSFVEEKDVQSGTWVTGILYLSVVDLCISCWKCYQWCSAAHVCCFFCRVDDPIEVSRWVPQKCSVTVKFCGITSYVYMCHSNILFCFQPGRRRNGTN